MSERTQQRVIDNVTISIEADTSITAHGPSADNSAARLYIGDPGYGSVVLWVDRAAANRLIRVILEALDVPLEVTTLPESPTSVEPPV